MDSEAVALQNARLQLAMTFDEILYPKFRSMVLKAVGDSAAPVPDAAVVAAGHSYSRLLCKLITQDSVPEATQLITLLQDSVPGAAPGTPVPGAAPVTPEPVATPVSVTPIAIAKPAETQPGTAERSKPRNHRDREASRSRSRSRRATPVAPARPPLFPRLRVAAASTAEPPQAARSLAIVSDGKR